MAIDTVLCHASGVEVTRIVDFEGTVTQLICPEYDASTGDCRLKRRAFSGGRLAEFLERVSDHSLSDRDTHCHMA